jgi:hypothetical protein
MTVVALFLALCLGLVAVMGLTYGSKLLVLALARHLTCRLRSRRTVPVVAVPLCFSDVRPGRSAAGAPSRGAAGVLTDGGGRPAAFRPTRPST